VIAPLERAPFYGIRLVIGDLGTDAGIKTDEHARALDGAGRPIPAFTLPATTWRAAWAAIIPEPASRSGRR
jgi:hypothetical protein